MEFEMPERLVWLSGSYSAKSLGATRTIDTNMVFELRKQGIDVIWLARGVDNQKDCYNLDSKANYGFFINLLRQLGDLFLRSLLKLNFRNVHQVVLFKLYDVLSFSILKINKLITADSIIVVRNGMSFRSIVYAKKIGAKTVVHNQWCHPFTQLGALKREFTSEGLSFLPFSKKRADLQLKDYSTADIQWSISTEVRSSLINHGVDPRHIIEVPLGVDYNKYCPSEIDQSLGKRKKIFQILFVGNVNLEKGVHILLKAIDFAKLSNIRVVFNGSIPKYFQPTFDSLLGPLKEKGIEIIVSPGDPVNNYHNSSIFVLPSIHESFGLVVLEAMAAGLPVIVSDNVGAKDCVLNKENGLIFPSGDVEALASGLLYFYNNQENMELFGKKSLEQALNYSWDKVAKQLMEKTINFGEE